MSPTTIHSRKVSSKTLKYRPEFPDRFGSLQDARSFCQNFFSWYNHEHHHSGPGLLTPEVVHCQRAEQVRNLRQQTLDIAYAAHPERFVQKPPQPPALPTRVWINPPPKLESDPADSEPNTQETMSAGVSKSLTHSASACRFVLQVPSWAPSLAVQKGQVLAELRHFGYEDAKRIVVRDFNLDDPGITAYLTDQGGEHLFQGCRFTSQATPHCAWHIFGQAP